MMVLGLVGSTHCLGMCGGFVLATGKRAPAYQAGRLLGYALVGAAMATAGWAARLGLGNRLFMLVAGLSMVALAANLLPARPPLWGYLLRVFGPLLRRPFFLGLLTAVLPCSLLAAAWMQAAASGSTLRGAAFMTCFWLGTLPALSFAHLLSPLARRWPRAGSLVVFWLGLTMLWRAWRGEVWCG